MRHVAAADAPREINLNRDKGASAAGVQRLQQLVEQHRANATYLENMESSLQTVRLPNEPAMRGNKTLNPEP